MKFITKGIIGLGICALTSIGCLAGVNCIKDSHREYIFPSKDYFGIRTHKRKVTGLISYAEHVRFRQIWINKPIDDSIRDEVDTVIKGNLLKEDERYVEINGDNTVDEIWIGQTRLYRYKDYEENKEKFDEADKYFLLYTKN